MASNQPTNGGNGNGRMGFFRLLGVRSPSDLLSLVLIFVTGVGVIQWGLKIEDRQEQYQLRSDLERSQLRARIIEIETILGPLILPMAERGIAENAEDIDDIEERLDRHEREDH